MAKNNNQIVDERIFIGSMDQDSDERFIGENDYRMMVNGIKTGIQSHQVVTNIKGTSQIDLSTISFPGYTQDIGSYDSVTIAGSAYDYVNNGLILLIKTDANKNIIRYKEDGTIEGILVDNAYLNFNTSAQVKVINDLLVWQEQGQEAQIINMDDARDGSATYDSTKDLSLIKPPPLYTITCTYGTDTSFHGSNVFRKMFQFRQQYIYLDSLKSAFGNTSNLAFNDDVFDIEDNVLQKQDTQNFIDIKFNSGDSLVQKIRIGAREGNNRDWFEIAIIDKNNPENIIVDGNEGVGTVSFATTISDNTTYHYRFFNTGGYRFIPTGEIQKPFEFLPVISDCLASFGNSRLAIGQNQLDYSQPDIGSLAMSPSYSALPASADVLPSLKRGRFYQMGIQFLDEYGKSCEPVISEDLEKYVEDVYDTTDKGVVEISVTGLGTVFMPSWAEYYQFVMTAPYIPFVQAPILYADQYRDLNGETDGTIALLLGFSVDAINDIIEDRIEELSKELDSVKGIIKVYEDTKLNRKVDAEQRLDKIEQNIEQQYGRSEAYPQLKDLNVNELKDKKEELEKDVTSKKQELNSSYKKALSNLRQFEINRNDRIRLVKKDFTDSTDVNQALDLQILDVFNENTYLGEDGNWQSQSGLWIKVNSPEVDGYTLEDVQKQVTEEVNWVKSTNEATEKARYDHASAVDSNGYVYIVGGYNPEDGNLNDVWRSNDNGENWTQMTANAFINGGRYGHALVIDSSDNLIVLGGKVAGGSFLNEVWISTDGGASWIEKGNTGGDGLWTARLGHKAVITSAGRLFVLGGCSDFNTTYHQDVWYTDMEVGDWVWNLATYTTVFSKRREMEAVISSGDIVYVMGGQEEDGTYKNDVWKNTNPASNDWVQVTPESGASWQERSNFAAVIDSYNRIFIFGGYYKSDTHTTRYPALNDMHLSVDGGATWAPLGYASWERRSAHTAAIDSNNQIFIIGGANAHSTPLDDVYYKPSESESQWVNSMLEIYKPYYSDTSNIFYEIPGIYTVGNTTNKTITPSNCFLKKQKFYSAGTRSEKGAQFEDWVEDTHLTHDFKSDNHNLGRRFIKTDIEKGLELPSIVFTNRHIEGTEINGLSQANYDNIVYLSEEHGKIYSIQEQGNILKAIQAHKISSVDQNKNVRPYIEDFGSIYPKSVIVSPFTNYIYGFDVYRGQPWRDVGNAVHSLAGKAVLNNQLVEYKMESVFSAVAEELRELGSSTGDVQSVYDYQNKLLYMSFLDNSELSRSVVGATLSSMDYPTVIFDERQNQWIGYIDIHPQSFASGQNMLLSSNYHNLWLHNSDSVDRLSLYGNAKELIVKIVANKPANVMKIFNSLWLHSSAKFEASSIIVPSGDTDTGREMKSKLSEAVLQERRGIYSAPFFKNMKTTDTTERTNELLTGENLAGYTLEITLKNDSTTKVKLFKVDILSEINY